MCSSSGCPVINFPETNSNYIEQRIHSLSQCQVLLFIYIFVSVDEYEGGSVFKVVERCGMVDVYGRFRGALIMKAANTCETFLNFYQITRGKKPEDPSTVRARNLG